MPFGIKDPSALLRPFVDLQQFTEELYAMHSQSPAEAAGKPAGKESASRPQNEAARPAAAAIESPVSGVVRSARVETAKARTVAPDAARPDPHSPSRRVTPAAQEQASRSRPEPDPSPSQPQDRAPSAPARPRSVSTTTVIDQRRRDAAGGGDHAKTLRAQEQTDFSRPVPQAGADYKPERKESSQAQTAAAQPDAARATQAESSPPPQSKAQGTARADYASAQEATKRAETATAFSPRLPLDIGDFAGAPAGGGGSTTIYLGKVLSGTGDTYLVALYPDGSKGHAGETVTVTVPTIDPDETIDAGTWISPVFEFPAGTDEFGNVKDGNSYECQPPVWMS